MRATESNTSTEEIPIDRQGEMEKGEKKTTNTDEENMHLNSKKLISVSNNSFKEA